METKLIAIGKIQADKHQPRQKIDHQNIEDLAQSIRTEGLINAIEVDKGYTIITGEQRWRAAKLAGLKYIPCKILDLKPAERFRRQVIENIHRNTMSDYDTAKALQKLLNLDAAVKLDQGKDAGINKLSKTIGKSNHFIREHLSLLAAPKEFQRAVRKEEVSLAHLEPLKSVRTEYRERFQKKIMSGEFQSRDVGRELAKAINRNPDKATELLKLDFRNLRPAEAVTLIGKVVPSVAMQVRANFQPPTELAAIKNALLQWCKKNPKQTIGQIHVTQIALTLSIMDEAIKNWIS